MSTANTPLVPALGSPSHGPFTTASGENGTDPRWLRIAAEYWRSGQRADALHYLERALPSDFAGLAQLAPENRP